MVVVAIKFGTLKIDAFEVCGLIIAGMGAFTEIDGFFEIALKSIVSNPSAAVAASMREGC